MLDFATGRGRNAAALELAGLQVTALDDATAASDAPFARLGEGRFDAAISTHGFLHGNAAEIERRVRAVARHLTPGAPFYATFGSSRDARFGRGMRIDERTYAPADGDEAGVAHAFFDRDSLRAILEPVLAIETLEERMVDEIAGSWAHRERPLERAVHWFAIAANFNTAESPGR
ncbi:MAG: class I SAM-dependent methyltransferase [Candidatus Eremiobacteraeota bacterium]|nr:class I SAM-dependent methyltransferase [Candidatus Eremiobacteraeota bacterium]